MSFINKSQLNMYMVVEFFKKGFEVLFKRDEKALHKLEENNSLSYLLGLYGILLLAPIVLLFIVIAIIHSIINFDIPMMYGMSPFIMMFFMMIGYIIFVILFQLFVVGTQHGSLKLFKGKASFEDTLKVFLIVGIPFLLINVGISFITTILSVIPFIGGIISFPLSILQLALLFWTIVVQGMFYGTTHSISSSKGMLAAFIPVIITIILLLILLIVGIIIAVSSLAL